MLEYLLNFYYYDQNKIMRNGWKGYATMRQNRKNQWYYVLCLGIIFGLNEICYAGDYIVTKGDDPVGVSVADGKTSLRDAIAKANYFGGKSTITFDPNVYRIYVNSPLPSVKSEITIIGDSRTSLMCTNCSAFFIDGGTITLKNLQIVRGYAKGGDGGGGSHNTDGGGGGAAGMGGAIFIHSGKATCENVFIAFCQAVGGNGGSYLSNPGFFDQYNHMGGGGGGCGGNGTDAYIDLWDPQWNQWTGYPGKGGNGGIFGGIGGGQDGNSSVNGGEGAGGRGCASEQSKGGNGGFGGGGGGGTYAGNGGFGGGGGGSWFSAGQGGLFGGDGLKDTVQYSFEGGGGGAGLGGAVFARSGTELNLLNCKFSGNKAIGGSGFGQSKKGLGKGGAIFVMDGASAKAVNVTFDNNDASDDGVSVGSLKLLCDTNDVWGNVTSDGSTAFPPVSSNSNWRFYE